VDINPELNPVHLVSCRRDIRCDAPTLANVPLETYDLVLCDPPYSVEDAERYRTTMIKRNSVISVLRRLSPGAHVVWLDQVLPSFDHRTLEAIRLMAVERVRDGEWPSSVVASFEFDAAPGAAGVDEGLDGPT
jgi:hypothetical protein